MLQYLLLTTSFLASATHTEDLNPEWYVGAYNAQIKCDQGIEGSIPLFQMVLKVISTVLMVGILLIMFSNPSLRLHPQ